MPPTTAELSQFQHDRSPLAKRRVVQRLLNSPAFGERMAVEWLDVARYGDTDGLFEDHPREIYPYRDWVVQAFNKNLSYRKFITWQLAGDLLTNSTVSQRIATGFLRNNPTSNEGGIIDEDYRVKYLVDRVNTTATAFLGLTLECAQCHDHKYDPMTQREYYQFAGFFNNLVGRGNTKGATAPTLRVVSKDDERRMQRLRARIAKLRQQMSASPKELLADFKVWQQRLATPISWSPVRAINAANSNARNENNEAANNEAANNQAAKNGVAKNAPLYQWDVDSAGWLTARDRRKGGPVSGKSSRWRGRYVRISYPKPHNGYLTLSEVEVVSAGRNVAPSGSAKQSSTGYSAAAARAIDGVRDGRFASCSCTNSEAEPWWELDLGKLTSIDRVFIWNRTDCCPERLDGIRLQILDDQRSPVVEQQFGKIGARVSLPGNAKPLKLAMHDLQLRLAVPQQAAAVVALKVEGRGGGKAKVTKLQWQPASGAAKAVRLVGKGDVNLTAKGTQINLAEPLSVGSAGQLIVNWRLPAGAAIRMALTSDATATIRGQVPKPPAKQLEFFRGRWPGFSEQRLQLQSMEKERQSIEQRAPLTMIAADGATPRKNYLLVRGEYDKRGPEVAIAGPNSIMKYDESLPANRLGLAQWLVDDQHPLTARVVVNRYWQMLFGTGLVKTSEDFGTQGERPSHEALLDYLAVDFVRSDWDVKRLLSQMVLSATYEQSSARNHMAFRVDPKNRWLAQMNRRRLPAEFLRDQALSVSGLLVDQLGGPGVNPYQPGELFGANAIGSARTRFKLGAGPQLYRRSLYTYWKRQIPAANMRLLGADGRTKCRTRRERTNTPLQALVMLNDPQFVEAARALACRSLPVNTIRRNEFAICFVRQRAANRWPAS